jgi:hypothetical protein
VKKETFRRCTVEREYERMAVRTTPERSIGARNKCGKPSQKAGWRLNPGHSYPEGGTKTKIRRANVSGHCKSEAKSGPTGNQCPSGKMIIPTLLKNMLGGSLIQAGIPVVENIRNCEDS